MNEEIEVKNQTELDTAIEKGVVAICVSGKLELATNLGGNYATL